MPVGAAGVEESGAGEGQVLGTQDKMLQQKWGFQRCLSAPNAAPFKFLVGGLGLDFSPSHFEVHPKSLGCVSRGMDGATERGLLLHLLLHEKTTHLL